MGEGRHRQTPRRAVVGARVHGAAGSECLDEQGVIHMLRDSGALVLGGKVMHATIIYMRTKSVTHPRGLGLAARSRRIFASDSIATEHNLSSDWGMVPFGPKGGRDSDKRGEVRRA